MNRRLSLAANDTPRAPEVEPGTAQPIEIDEAMADPIRDHLPEFAPKHRTNRVLSILDQLDAGKANHYHP